MVLEETYKGEKVNTTTCRRWKETKCSRRAVCSADMCKQHGAFLSHLCGNRSSHQSGDVVHNENLWERGDGVTSERGDCCLGRDALERYSRSIQPRDMCVCVCVCVERTYALNHFTHARTRFTSSRTLSHTHSRSLSRTLTQTH
jgi:hypothetical protein